MKASFNERLLLGNGLCVTPLRSQQEPVKRSLREVVSSIDNERDFNNYVSSFASKVANTGDIKYERHPVRIRLWRDVTSVLTPRRLLYLTNRHRRRTIIVPSPS